jgi:hypothetical protein
LNSACKAAYSIFSQRIAFADHPSANSFSLFQVVDFGARRCISVSDPFSLDQRRMALPAAPT